MKKKITPLPSAISTSEWITTLLRPLKQRLMINFIKNKDEVILSYSTSDQPSHVWVYDRLDKSESVTIGTAFKFTKKELLSVFDKNEEDKPVEFRLASRDGDYYRFPKDILSLEDDLYIHEDVKIEKKLFVTVRDISIFPKIDKMVIGSIYLGGTEDDAIPVSIYDKLLKAFPGTYELNMYASARISSVLSSYIDTKKDYEEKYEKYMNTKISRKGDNLQFQFSEQEEMKYTSILKKLYSMLDGEISYTETQWQIEISEIILLLYPKYIHVFSEAPVRDTYSNTNRYIDYLLVDSSGNTDIIEMKKPCNKSIVTEREYRDNYIPLRELSGTVMQVEKYIFYLNKCGRKGEEKLTKHYKDKLAENFKIRITNPSGIIIMGRNKDMSISQQQDFEVIKRQYKNIIDIITYDDLLERIKFTIARWTQINSADR